MSSNITKADSPQRGAGTTPQLFDDWFDPIETEVRDRARQFIEELIRSELDAALARPRYGRGRTGGDEAGRSVTGHRHGSRMRSLDAVEGRGVALGLPVRSPVDDVAWTSTMITYPRTYNVEDTLLSRAG